MGFFSNLFGFGKSKVDPDYMSTAHLIPSYYSSFPVYRQKIIDTPQEKRTEKPAFLHFRRYFCLGKANCLAGWSD